MIFFFSNDLNSMPVPPQRSYVCAHKRQFQRSFLFFYQSESDEQTDILLVGS